jgi:hypothetical protein
MDFKANRGIDIEFSRKPITGNFRVVGVDTFDGSDWVQGEFETLEEAKKCAVSYTAGQQMLKMHIYDKDGNHVFDCGSF